MIPVSLIGDGYCPKINCYCYCYCPFTLSINDCKLERSYAEESRTELKQGFLILSPRYDMWKLYECILFFSLKLDYSTQFPSLPSSNTS